MIVKILKQTLNEFKTVNVLNYALDEFDFNQSLNDIEFPCVVLYNDIQSTETIQQSGFFNGTSFTIRFLIALQLDSLDDPANNILEKQDEARTIARSVLYNLVQHPDFQKYSLNDSVTMNTVPFQHGFNEFLAGVFADFTVNLRLPIEYCKIEC